MGTRLVTIATFDQPAKARLAENALRAAGVQVTVSDESLVAMDWLLSSAVGGVKVQVWEEDADRAVNVLEREFGEDGAGLGPVDINPTELAAEAEGSTSEEDTDRPERVSVEEPEEPPTAAPYSPDEYARRMVFAAILGLIFWPVAFYALYLFLNAVFGEGRLSRRGRFNLFIGGLLLSPLAIVVCVILLFFVLSL
ncbi:MAG: hypothetical protein JWO38_6198 [Gemmataceae bacterium]|nr:hypothetical protein [Gemmataceae bacterium]